MAHGVKTFAAQSESLNLSYQDPQGERREPIPGTSSLILHTRITACMLSQINKCYRYLRELIARHSDLQ